ncbi:hypothetical protein OBRU01_05243 [Operophtera brumata]|uniref:Integrase zinc-binding domain-containing protein n=1 Tax=Operophtera brumata TaxID=104452 RepID=A0A0L7LML1_OPEBR|nr:hypothetical protein OBRU01_05243 [Operophtera brumata]
MDKGPNRQQDLPEIILKWRQYRYAYTADIEKADIELCSAELLTRLIAKIVKIMNNFKVVVYVSNISENSSIVEDLLNRHSSFNKITRILAWILRALTPIVSKQNRPSYLTLHELRAAKWIIIKQIQCKELNIDIENLLRHSKVKSDSKLANLNPYMDENGLMRVKGRLSKANISAEMRFPIIIPYSSRLTELLIQQAHELTFHGGPRLTMAFIRQRYWIVKGNRAVKKQLLMCVTCRKQEPNKSQQIMGEYPDFRTNPAPTFYHTGVDFTGFIKLSVRSKWLKSKKNIEVGEMVTIHDDNYSSGRFPVGRVIEVHKGNDGFVRVVSLKTKNGIIKRPIIKLSILPIEQSKKLQQDEVSKQNVEHLSKHSHQVGGNQRPNFIKVAFAWMFFMSVIGLNVSANVTQFTSNQSLYYDPVGKMQLIRDQWKIVCYYDMRPYWQGDKAVNSFTKYLEQTCDKVKEASHCNMILLQVKYDYSELQYYNQLLLNQHFGERSRTRRGLINAVGSIANTLFGVLDQSFADKYQQDIELVNSNEKHLLKLWKNQTSVVEAEYNVLKRTEQAIESQHKLLNRHLNFISQSTKQLQKEYESMSILQEFTLAAMATTNMVQNLRRIQDTILDTLTDIYHGKINLHLLTPKQLSGELQVVSSQISKELTLPIDNIQTNLYKIYQLLKIKARMTKDYVIFEISLPLISRDSFQLYHLIPVPLQISSDMISINLVTDYIATNLMRDSYLPVTSIDFLSCEYQDEAYICQPQVPIQHLSLEERFCQTDRNNTCKIKRESCQNKWVQLHDPSFYLYFACNTYSLTIVCDRETRVRQISKAGLIHLSKQCTAKGRDVTLHSYQQQITLNLKSDLALINIAPIHHHTFNFTLPFTETTEDRNLNTSLQQLGEQISAMKEAAQQEVTLTTHDIHQYVISYSVLAAGVAAFLAFLWRRAIRASAARASEPAPAPVPLLPRETPSSRASGACSRKQSVPELGHGSSGTVRWSSLRDKDTITALSSSEQSKQSVFTIE